MHEVFLSKYNNQVKTDVYKKHIYLALQYDELLHVAALVQIYKIRTHESNIPHEKFAVFPISLYFFKINSMFESQQQLQLTWSGKILSRLPAFYR